MISYNTVTKTAISKNPCVFYPGIDWEQGMSEGVSCQQNTQQFLFSLNVLRYHLLQGGAEKAYFLLEQ